MLHLRGLILLKKDLVENRAAGHVNHRQENLTGNPRREKHSSRTGENTQHQIENSIQIVQKNLSTRKNALTEKSKIFHPLIAIDPFENLSLTNPRKHLTKRTGEKVRHSIEISIQSGQKDLSIRKNLLTEKSKIFPLQKVISPIENLTQTNPGGDLTKSLIKKIPAKKDLIKRTLLPADLLRRCEEKIAIKNSMVDLNSRKEKARRVFQIGSQQKALRKLKVLNGA